MNYGQYVAHRNHRANSLAQYAKPCPVTMKPHDWRHATDAPGWKIGDECVRCEKCGLKAIARATSTRNAVTKEEKP